MLRGAGRSGPEESGPGLPQDRVSASESGQVPLAFKDTFVSLDGLSKLRRQVWVTTALCGEQAVRSPPAGFQVDPEGESISSGVGQASGLPQHRGQRPSY